MSKGKIITCSQCGKRKPHEAFGLRKACYCRQYSMPTITCAECGGRKPHQAQGNRQGVTVSQ